MANPDGQAPDGFLPGAQDMSYETFAAVRVNLYVANQLSAWPGMSKNAHFEYHRAHIDSMVARIVTWCVSGRIEDTVTTHKISYPDGVWQTFKEKYLPHWFTEKFPVHMKTVEVRETVNHYFVCPHLVTDPQNAHVQFMATGTRMAGRIRP